MGDGPLVRQADLVGLEEPQHGALAPARPACVSACACAASPRPQPGSEEERAALLNALACTNENITLTAQELGVSRVTLYRMLRRHAINLHRGLRPSPAMN
jgi:transcriptional regulator of acetoin/glycerol metabolism